MAMSLPAQATDVADMDGISKSGETGYAITWPNYRWQAKKNKQSTTSMRQKQ